MNVYVSAPFAEAHFVRHHIHPRLKALGIKPTSSWAEEAHGGPEDFDMFSPGELQAIAAKNDADLEKSDAVLLYDPMGEGYETYCEVRFAIVLGKQVVWCGSRCLSRWRAVVRRVDSLDAGLAELRTMMLKSRVSQMVAE